MPTGYAPDAGFFARRPCQPGEDADGHEHDECREPVDPNPKSIFRFDFQSLQRLPFSIAEPAPAQVV
jgi:hypothetical protein